MREEIHVNMTHIRKMLKRLDSQLVEVKAEELVNLKLNKKSMSQIK